jgi:putative salt-induced outer membrane protein YdiY
VTVRRVVGPALIVALLSSPSAAQPAEGRDDEREIRAIEEALAKALHARSRSQLEPLLAPDFVLRSTPDIDRDTWLRSAVDLCWGDRSDMRNFQARSLNGVAVATFELTFYVDPTTCRPSILRSLITDVWVRQADRWQLQIRHSAAPPQGSGVVAQYGIVPEPLPTWDVSSELSFVATSGNTSTRSIGLGGSLTHRHQTRTSGASIAFFTNEVDGVTEAESIGARIRHGIQVRDRLQIFGEGSYGRDRFAGLDDRVVVAGGLSYATSVRRSHVITADGGFGFTSEDRLDGRHLRFASATGAVRYAWEIKPTADVTQDIRLNADLQSAANWHGTTATAVTVTVTRVVSLRFSHVLEYRNAPVAGFGRTDARTAITLVLSVRQ